MKPDKILYAMNDIDGEFLREARAEAASTRRSRKFTALIAAVIALMALTVTAFAAEDIESWFKAFLGTKYVPETWLDASVAEDYSVELLTEPVNGIPGYQFDGDDVMDLTIVSVRLRPGSLMMLYHATDFGSTFNYYPGEVKVILLDGTETLLIPGGFGRISEDPDSLDWVEFASEVPPMDEIDYIELPGGTKITVP